MLPEVNITNASRTVRVLVIMVNLQHFDNTLIDWMTILPGMLRSRRIEVISSDRSLVLLYTNIMTTLTDIMKPGRRHKESGTQQQAQTSWTVMEGLCYGIART